MRNARAQRSHSSVHSSASRAAIPRCATKGRKDAGRVRADRVGGGAGRSGGRGRRRGRLTAATSSGVVVR